MALAGLVRQESGVEQYLKEIQAVPLLTAKEEMQLARRMKRIGSSKEEDRKEIQRNVKDVRARLKTLTDALEQSPDELKQTLDTIIRGEYQAEPAKKEKEAELAAAAAAAAAASEEAEALEAVITPGLEETMEIGATPAAQVAPVEEVTPRQLQAGLGKGRLG